MVKFSKFCSKRLHGETDRRCCVQNVAKFVRREIGEIMRYLVVQERIRLLQLLILNDYAARAAIARHYLGLVDV